MFQAEAGHVGGRTLASRRDCRWCRAPTGRGRYVPWSSTILVDTQGRVGRACRTRPCGTYGPVEAAPDSLRRPGRHVHGGPGALANLQSRGAYLAPLWRMRSFASNVADEMSEVSASQR